MSRRTYPHVYRAIHRVIVEFAEDGIPKNHINLQEQYTYRSIDDVTARLAPLLAKHGLCTLPRLLRRHAESCCGDGGEELLRVVVLAAFDLVSSRDGSRHTVRAGGEALDAGDKGTAKAMSSAFKYAMIQTFCIPVPVEDADGVTRRVRSRATSNSPEPPQGWEAWASDIVSMFKSCESVQALNLLRSRNARELAALKKSRAALYQTIGEAYQRRSQELADRVKPAAARKAKMTADA